MNCSLSDIRWFRLPFEIKPSFPVLVVIVSSLLLNLVYVVLFFVCLNYSTMLIRLKVKFSSLSP